MKQIIIGTKNAAKIAQLRGALAPLDIEIAGLPGDIELPEVEENGTAQENARKKALAYARAIGQPVLSMDNALYLDGLPQDKQPGTNVRRIGERTDRPTDNEMLLYYSDLIKSLGGQINGHWEFAICVAQPDGSTQETTITSPRLFTSQRSTQVVAGYPLESIQIEPETGRYISEMTQAEQDIFWQKAIGSQLCDFVKNLQPQP